MGENALTIFYDKLQSFDQNLEGVKKVLDLKEIGEGIDEINEGAVLLMDLINNLKIEDATKTSSIIDNISGVFSVVNQARAKYKNKLHSLQSVEAESEFNAQLKLMNQSVTNYIDQADTPRKCEEMMTKVIVQLEELESRFADFDEYIEKLTVKRDEVYSAFNSRKVQLEETLNRKTQSLFNSSERIIKGISNRIKSIDSIDGLNGYFASDLMVQKLRQIIEKLMDLGDSVKSENIASQLKTVQQEGARQLKDKIELFTEGADIISLGNHKFTVNTQEFDLTTVVRDKMLYYHLSGTEYFESVDKEFVESTREFWDQELVSETPMIYRAEYLAFQIIRQIEREGKPVSMNELEDLVEEPEKLQELVKNFMANHFDEGYEKGIHDHDTTTIFETLIPMYQKAGTLRYNPVTRALGTLFWLCSPDSDRKKKLSLKIQSFGDVLVNMGGVKHQAEYIAQLQKLVDEFYGNLVWKCDLEYLRQTPAYLFEELIKQEDPFPVNRFAEDIYSSFNGFLKKKKSKGIFETAIKGAINDLASQISIALDWVTGFVDQENKTREPAETLDPKFILETVSIILRKEKIENLVKPVVTKGEIEGLLGNHRKIKATKLSLDLSEFVPQLQYFSDNTVPAYRRYVDEKREKVSLKKNQMHLDDFKPKVMSSFVRNKLLNTLYLPLIGANMAKQIGEYGAGKRTDLMGLLILISPPGYGKTTLMEYISNRVGLVFMKINGPAIGHSVTSLDPVEAPNATAAEEINKLNLALEMGNNIMLYLDDIQHCNPEFLQKFISLCDAQRKIEGVYKGNTKTYDLKGKKVMVVMAGNPYTESGEKFRIPDMLANRADTYNLGDITGGSKEAFEMSYLENCLTSSSTLNKLASRSQHDVYEMIRIAETDQFEGADFEASYPLDEVKECVNVFKKLMTIRDVVLKVNLQYIHSAEQDDAYRTEPSFLLQGSYRNMNKMAEKVAPVMNEKEIKQLILNHYSDESQLLTTGAEFNLIRFKEMLEWQTPEEQERMDYIRTTYSKNLAGGKGGEDPVRQISSQIQLFNDRFETVADVLTEKFRT